MENEAYPGVYTLKIVSVKRPKYQRKRFLDLSIFLPLRMLLLVLLFGILKIVFSSCMFALKS